MKAQSSRYRKLKEKLGEGSYKTVTKAIDEEEGKEVAYNEVRIKNYEEETQASSSFSKEIALLKNIDHPYIIKIFDYWFTEDDFVFITELMTGGTLREYIEKVGPLNGKLIRKWGRQMLEGLRYLHTLDPPVIHRDIKTENIFVNSSQGEIKIGDLGIAKEKKHKRYTIVGTPSFMAREMFEGEGYSEKVDIYAFGMCLIEMATGRTPYSEFEDSSEIYRNVLRGVLPESIHDIKDSCLRSLVMGCMVPYANRYSAGQCLDHHFFYPDVVCQGDCIPSECVTVFPLADPVRGMELSLISFNESIITFQILLTDSSRFIKFDYDLENDSLEKVSTELIEEKIIANEAIDAFMGLLEQGINKALQKRAAGQIRDGIFELDSSEMQCIGKRAPPTSDGAQKPGCALRGAEGAAGERADEMAQRMADLPAESFDKKFGEKTLEEMREIDEKMTAWKQRLAEEEQRDKKLSQRLKAKLEHKDASYEARDSTASMPERTSGEVAPLEIDKCMYSYSDKAVSTESLNSVAPPAAPAQRAEAAMRESVIASPPAFIASRLSDEQAAAENLSLSEGYKTYKAKYKTNYSVAQFALDAASITGRTEDTAKSWIKSLRDEDLETVFDLKLIVYEDWERLPLTVFSSRAMQNMLYGIDNIPMKEKQLPMNPNMKDYDNRLSIKEFLEDVCAQINRPELTSKWENRLMAQDVRTVAELKSLHQEDWGRLGLSVFAYRILKNVIFRKGRIMLE